MNKQKKANYEFALSFLRDPQLLTKEQLQRASTHFEQSAERRLTKTYKRDRLIQDFKAHLRGNSSYHFTINGQLAVLEPHANGAAAGLQRASESARLAGDNERANKLLSRAGELKEHIAERYMGDSDIRTVFDLRNNTSVALIYLDQAIRFFNKAENTEAAQRVETRKDEVLKNDRIAGIRVALRIVGIRASPEVKDFLENQLKKESGAQAAMS